MKKLRFGSANVIWLISVRAKAVSCLPLWRANTSLCFLCPTFMLFIYSEITVENSLDKKLTFSVKILGLQVPPKKKL